MEHFIVPSAKLIIKQVAKNYRKHWDLNDPGHRMPHFLDVWTTSLEIAARLGMAGTFDRKAALFFALFHDLFAWSRVNHNMLASNWFLTTDCDIVLEHYPNWDDGGLHPKRIMLANAIAEHRSGYKGAYSSTFSEIMASADRGRPQSIETYMERAVSYRTHRGESLEQAKVGASQHLLEKFGRNGYARHPELYRKAYGAEIERMWDELDSLYNTYHQ